MTDDVEVGICRICGEQIGRLKGWTWIHGDLTAEESHQPQPDLNEQPQ